MNSALEQIWKRADLRGHVISYDETRRWPATERETIFRVGILRQIQDAEVVTCDACADPHEEEIILLGTDTEPRIWCPEVGLVRVPVERLRLWEVDFDSAARLLSGALELSGNAQVVTSGRIWLLGKRRVADRMTEFFLVQGIAWPDNVELLCATPRLQNSPAPIIFCPHRLPEAPEWQQNGRAMFRLSELTGIENSRLIVRIEDFEDLHPQIAARLEQEIVPSRAKKRPVLIEEFCKRNNCKIKDICRWATVHRQDLNAWKLGKPEVPDGGEKANRIERLLQFSLRARR